MNEHKHHGHPDHHRHGNPVAAAAWNGSYTTIAQGQSSIMTPPNAFTLVALTNLGNGAENVILTAGAITQPMTLPPQQNAPSMYINNLSPSNLTVFNQGPASTIGAIVAGFGQGGIQPTPIVLGTPLPMSSNTYAQGTSNPNLMDLNFKTTTGALTTFVVMGGTTPSSQGSTTRAIVVQLNAPATVGPATSTVFDNTQLQPTGTSNLIYAATTSAQYDILYNFGASNIWVANVSATTAAGASITLTSLG